MESDIPVDLSELNHHQSWSKQRMATVSLYLFISVIQKLMSQFFFFSK